MITTIVVCDTCRYSEEDKLFDKLRKLMTWAHAQVHARFQPKSLNVGI